MPQFSPNDNGAEAEFFVDRFYLRERSNLRYRAFMTWRACW